VVDVREAADKMAVAQVHVRSWQEGYREIVAQDYLDGLRPEDLATRYAFEKMDLSGLGLSTSRNARRVNPLSTGRLTVANVVGYEEIRGPPVVPTPDRDGQGCPASPT
jgi:hypothetical protein